MITTTLESIARAVTPGYDQLSNNSRRNALITARETLRAAHRLLADDPNPWSALNIVIETPVPR